VTAGDFDGTARVATGSEPTSAVSPYRVRVERGRLRLVASGASGTVVDVPLDRVGARPLGRAGATVVRVDGSPILVDFTRRAATTEPGVAGTVRRVGPALRGRWTRRRFLSATGRRGR
jgi:hypothetical protein